MLLPKTSPYVSSEVSIFDTLVKAGEEKLCTTLPRHLHAFLVRCLVGHLYDIGIVQCVFAVSFLESATTLGEQGSVVLERTGDAALIVAGFFPERALRLNVSSVYFRFMGQAAYASLAVKCHVTGKPERGKLYDNVAEHFHLLEKVLNAARGRPETTWEAFLRFRLSLQ